jgi:predicted MPP superfamily phosphohydrolase
MRNADGNAGILLRRVLLLLVLLAASALVWGYAGAIRTPLVRRAELALPGWPAGARPIRLLLLSDIHVAGPDMPPSRLAGIVAQANALEPDLVLIAGDLVSDKRSATRTYSLDRATAPLGSLRSRLGTFAVLGNHDHWRNANEARRSLAAASVRVIDNSAVQAGPVAIGGLDDAFTDHDDLAATVSAVRRLEGARILLSHSPDPFPDTPADISLMLAGHTHCGQIVLPLLGPMSTMSRHGKRYVCGLVREGGKALVVSAGLGTSILPLRVGARPDMWLLQLGPAETPVR